MRPFAPELQPDEVVLQRVLRRVIGRTMPLAEVVARLQARGLPPQLVQTPFVTVLTAAKTPALVIPKNPNRMSLLVATQQDTIVLSYGPPAGSNSLGVLGLPITVQSAYIESNGGVSIDDIYVTCNDVNGSSFTASIAGQVMNVTAVASGSIGLGNFVFGAGVAPGTITTSAPASGGVGNWGVSISQNVGAEAMTTTKFPIYVIGYEGTLALTGNPPPPAQDGAQW